MSIPRFVPISKVRLLEHPGQADLWLQDGPPTLPPLLCDLSSFQPCSPLSLSGSGSLESYDPGVAGASLTARKNREFPTCWVHWRCWKCVTLSLVETCLGNQNDKRGTGKKATHVVACGLVTCGLPVPGNETGGRPLPGQTILENKEGGRTGQAVAV